MLCILSITCLLLLVFIHQNSPLYLVFCLGVELCHRETGTYQTRSLPVLRSEPLTPIDQKDQRIHPHLRNLIEQIQCRPILELGLQQIFHSDLAAIQHLRLGRRCRVDDLHGEDAYFV